jgi:UDP-N-acetyl-D-mannosaminuronic acid dehydrogenase
VFSTLTRTLVELSMTEAELAKLFTNSWRYIRFAVANQFYMIAQEKGHDFYRIREAMGRDYPRAADLPPAGFAAGPCLFKDTMQLAAYCRQNFALGQASMLVNETMPDYLVEHAKRQTPLAGRKVGILGMAFKPDNDDKRESLAYKLRKLLVYEGARVLCTDPYLKDADFVPLKTVLKECDILFIGCPHAEYRKLKFSGKRVIDCWDMVRPA